MSNLIVVSGFGPFRQHEQANASWEAVKHLPDEVDFAGKKFPIRKIEIPVEYAEVENTVQEIWKLNPMLVIHCGVHGKIQRINVELMARNGNFCELDYSGQRLGCTTTTLTNNGSSCESLQTRFDVNKIVNELNDACGDNRFYCSDDVGNYLCCFIYLKSLDICTERTLFIHVPPIIPEFQPEFTAKCVQDVILKCLQQRKDQGKLQ